MIRVEGLVKKGHNMAKIRIAKVDRRLAKQIAKVIDKAGIDVLAISGGVLAGSTSACVLRATATAAGLTEKSAPVNAAVNIGCTVAGICVTSAATTMLEGKLLESYADALENRNASLATINDIYQE